MSNMHAQQSGRAFTKKQAQAMLEKIYPQQFKARRVRNIVRRTMGKTKTKEFTSQLDAVLSAVERVHDLDDQLFAMNPRLHKGQRDGTIARERNDAITHLLAVWTELVSLV